jgi:hypothetical protein
VNWRPASSASPLRLSVPSPAGTSNIWLEPVPDDGDHHELLGRNPYIGDASRIAAYISIMMLGSVHRAALRGGAKPEA